MTQVRIVKVNGVRYVQAVDRVAGKIDVLRSFGKYTLESYLEAVRYQAIRDALIEVAKEWPKIAAGEEANIHGATLAVFGYFLGMHEVERIIHAEEKA